MELNNSGDDRKRRVTGRTAGGWGDVPEVGAQGGEGHRPEQSVGDAVEVSGVLGHRREAARSRAGGGQGPAARGI